MRKKVIGKPCAGEPHARFDEELLVKLKKKGNQRFTLLPLSYPPLTYSISLNFENPIAITIPGIIRANKFQTPIAISTT